MTWSPLLCIAKLVMLPELASSFFTSCCRARSYTRTAFSVATKKTGLLGWKATRTTRPRFLRKGFWLLPLDSWCTKTACTCDVISTCHVMHVFK